MNKNFLSNYAYWQWKEIRKKLLQFYVIFFSGWAVAGILAILLKMRVWQNYDFLYKELHFVNTNWKLLLLMLFACGNIVVIYKGMSQALHGLDYVLDAVSKLAGGTDVSIQFPREYKELESILNKIRTQLQESKYHAKEAEQRKNDLVVYLAHDLKTPLTSVIGYLSLLNDEKEISEELRKRYMSIALNKAERLEDLVNEFFEITRFNLTHISLEKTKINLTRMMEQIIFEFQPMLMEKNLTCRLEAPKQVDWQCDSDKIQRVFDNLLKNAVNYSYASTEILIRIVQEKTKIYVNFYNKGADIPPEKLDRIFEQFFRLDSSRGTKTGGAGVGLAIAKEIVELHGGSIRVESRNEQIWFQVVFPASLENR